MGLTTYLEGKSNALLNAFAGSNSRVSDSVLDAQFSRIISTWQDGRPLPHTLDVGRFIDEGFRRNAMIFACIMEIANAFSQPPIFAKRRLGEGKDQLVSDKQSLLPAILRKPNRYQMGKEFRKMHKVYSLVAGNSYIKKLRSKAGQPVGLQLLRPDRVQVEPFNSGRDVVYIYSIDGQVVETIESQNMIHFKEVPDPGNDFYGLSPLKVLAAYGDIDNNVADYIRAFFFNHAAVAGIYSIPGETQPKERRRLRQVIRENFTGKKGWHTEMILDNGAKYEKVGTEPKALALESIFGFAECRIAQVFQVPPILIGSWFGLTRSTDTNYKNAKAQFWEDTATQHVTNYDDKMSEEFAVDFGKDVYIETDLSGVAALKDDNIEEWKFYLDAWNSDGITLNQFLEGTGKEPLGTEGDFRKSELFPQGTVMIPGAEFRRAKHETASRKNGHDQAASDPNLEQFQLTKKQWKAIHAVADAAEPKIRREFLRVIARTQDSIVERNVEAALARGDFEAAIEAIDWDALDKELMEGMNRVLSDAVSKGATAANAFMPASIDIDFDATNPEAVRWIQDHAADLVKGINQETRTALKTLLNNSFEQGITVQDTARQMRQYLGLTDAQSQAVSNRIGSYLEQGKSMDYALERGQAYARKLVRQRATMIARTESIIASNKGQEALWHQAAEQGLIDPAKTKRKFLITDDDRLCPECEAFSGKTTTLDEPFVSDSGQEVMTPGEVHPQDRCSQGLVFEK